jgi:hypothetical protein
MEMLSQVEFTFPPSFVVNFLGTSGKSAFDEVHDEVHDEVF